MCRPSASAFFSDGDDRPEGFGYHVECFALLKEGHALPELLCGEFVNQAWEVDPLNVLLFRGRVYISC